MNIPTTVIPSLTLTTLGIFSFLAVLTLAVILSASPGTALIPITLTLAVTGYGAYRISHILSR